MSNDLVWHIFLNNYQAHSVFRDIPFDLNHCLPLHTTLQGYSKMLSLFSLGHVSSTIFLKYWTTQRTNGIYLNNIWWIGEAHTLAENLCLLCCVACFFVSVLHFVYVFCIFKLSLCGPHKISVYVICINLCNLCKLYSRKIQKKCIPATLGSHLN